MRRTSTLVTALLVTSVISAGACGTSGSKKSADQSASKATTSTAGKSSTTTGPTSTSSPPTSAANPEGERRAKAANIVAGDFPAGWTATARSGGASQIFATCAPEIDLETRTTARASSPDFTRKQGSSQTQANSTTRVLSPESTARTVIAKLGAPSFVACVDGAVKKQGLQPGTASGSLQPVAVSNLGDEAAGIDGKISGVDTATKKQVTVGVSLIAIRTGDLVTLLTGVSLGPTQSGDGVLFQKLAQAVADRQKA